MLLSHNGPALPLKNQVFSFGGTKGLFLVYDDQGKVGYFDCESKVFVPPMFESIGPWTDQSLLPAKDLSGKLGVLQRDSGEWIIPPIYYGDADSSYFHDGYALMGLSPEDDRAKVYVDQNGVPHKLSPLLFPLSEFKQKFAIIGNVDGFYGLIDSSMHVVIEPIWSEIIDYNRSYVITRQNETYYIIKINGTHWSRVPEGVYPVSIHNDLILYQSDDDKFGFINMDGKITIPADMDDIIISDTLYDVIWFVKDNRVGLMDDFGRIILKPKYELPNLGYPTFFNNLQPISCDGLWGYVDSLGEEKIDFRFDWAESFNKSLAFVSEGGIRGYINSYGEYVWREQY